MHWNIQISLLLPVFGWMAELCWAGWAFWLIFDCWLRCKALSTASFWACLTVWSAAAATLEIFEAGMKEGFYHKKNNNIFNSHIHSHCQDFSLQNSEQQRSENTRTLSIPKVTKIFPSSDSWNSMQDDFAPKQKAENWKIVTLTTWCGWMLWWIMWPSASRRSFGCRVRSSLG